MCGSVAGRNWRRTVRTDYNNVVPIQVHLCPTMLRETTLNILKINIKSLSNFPSMPIPNGSMMDATVNKLFLDKLDYDVDTMRQKLKKYLSSITDEQKKVFNDIMDVVTNKRGETIINVASSGIASLLLPGGKTAHSRF
ncbi:PREDICTED: uncharacterized protein LOC105972124 [Erythranthe guttata]|uniref:uncharacterized protein LOC105972124 n=1 Tax=Erythranthe guttata TaxID=4155 RepID=UPI00064DCCB0|nr:PREDICTED: uncharacterized protein LOC105972124 [Erythranthe guttata]|eukprot:XP_012852521.1 PREDICTED: uncharacterized protein LOC105972124 [Erythranthe guttata]